MLTSVDMKNIMQKDVSKDAQKTKDRINQDFMAAPTKVKHEIVELAGQHRNSYDRVRRTGSANARLILAVSQVLGISPYYYTGEDDEKTPCSDDLINKFLDELGYDFHKKAAKPKQKRTRKAKQQENIEENVSSEQDEAEALPTQDFDIDLDTDETDMDDAIIFALELSDSPEMQQAVSELTEDDAVLLLKSLLVRAKAGGEAAQFAEAVKRCLLS